MSTCACRVPDAMQSSPGSGENALEYFVTGATGFIGRRLVRRLLARRGAIVHFLVRDASPERLDALYAFWGVDRARAVPIEGDLACDGLGIAEAARSALKGRIRHLFHLAAIYDLAADAQRQVEINVEGTRRVVAFAEAIGVGCLHHVSSIAAAGLYDGVFREDMFDEAEELDNPYFATKHDSEAIVRRESRVPFRIYRPGMVVGDSRTGEIDKVDGPMYFFKPLQRLRRLVPQWMPMVGIEGGRINIVPVDYVVAAMDHIAHARGLDGKCFHLVDPHPLRVGDVLNLFARAAHAPQMSIRINAALIGLIPRHIRRAALALAPVRRIRDAILQDLGLPPDILRFVNYPTRFDAREALAALEGTGIACPRLEDYAWVLWDYWERHLDPELAIDRTLRGQVGGRVVLITGGSSGIGLAAARRVAAALHGRRAAMLDAPVSGGAQGAQDATLAIMVGGSAEVLERVRPLLACLGRTIVHIGGNGAGQVAKACNQMIMVAAVEACAEAMHLANAHGVDLAAVRAALSGGSAASRVLDVMGERMVRRDFGAGIESRLHHKDFGILMDEAAKLGAPLPVAAQVWQQLNALMALGGARDDTSSLLRVLERASGCGSDS